MSDNAPPLQPGWSNKGAGGRGFQPPPAVSSSASGGAPRDKARSSSWGSQGERSTGSANKFAALDEDIPISALQGDKPPTTNPRSEAFRASFRSSSTGSKGGGPGGASGGLSLSDLAARVPEPVAGNRRHSSYTRGVSTGDPRADRPRYAGGHRSSDIVGGSLEAYKPDVKVTRYTRERLLSMRPAPQADAALPVDLHEFEGQVIISSQPQDPVCWDTFDAEEIWAAVAREHRPSIVEKGAEQRLSVREDVRRRPNHAPPNGRWQRGVALPPPDAAGATGAGGSRRKEADNPEDLWDDPVGGATGAAADFSAFGAIPPDTGDPFDFDKIAEASLKLEEELHGKNRNSQAEGADDDDDPSAPKRKVDSTRPLTSAGTTIASGSGDNVSVFEDFESVGENAGAAKTQAAPTEAVRNGENSSASSRLMQMIGVTKTEDTAATASAAAAPKVNPWGSPAEDPASNNGAAGGVGGGSSVIPLNPWGDPIIASAPVPAMAQNQAPSTGMDLAARLQGFSNNPQASQQQQQQQPPQVRDAQQAELLRRRQVEEENQRRALAERQAAQQRAQAAQQQQQQQNSQRTQVELVLMERIGTILEGAWGRSDLGSILSRLHSEDTRVIPLLSNVDALRALLLRNTQRVALRHDPSFSGEMAILLMTNAQWQQTRAKQEELQRRRMEEEAAAAAAQPKPRPTNGVPQFKPNMPWYYSDPQQNIQGPFRNEEMRQWLVAGYFKGDLPISQEKTGPFLQLDVIFPNLAAAFQVVDDTAAKEAAAAKAKAEAEEAERQRQQEQQQQQRQQEERERLAAEAAAAEAAAAAAKAEAEAREAAERKQRELAEKERKQQEEQAARAAAEAKAAAEAEAAAAAKAEQAKAAASANNESSNKLKMMLGLSRGAAPAGDATAGAVQQQQQQSPPAQPTKPKESATKKNEKKKTNKKPQQKQQLSTTNMQTLTPTTATAPAPVPVKPAPAWGGAATSKPRKTMSEIQQEEARASATLAMQRERMGVNQPNNSGWANVAATGKTGWTSGTLRPGTSMMQPPAAMTAAPRAQNQQQQPRGSNSKASTGGGASRPSAGTQRQTSTASATPAEEFGTTMPPALERWCKEQMLRISGSDDLTLIAFCMTLTDATEIRQYLVEYLGSTSQVNNFATEFINKRGLGTAPEQWEMSSSSKKGRKKKGGR